jgi:hypothetical protein
LEHDDMASEQQPEKSNATKGKPAPDSGAASPQPPIPSPLQNDGPELVRDSHC